MSVGVCWRRCDRIVLVWMSLEALCKTNCPRMKKSHLSRVHLKASWLEVPEKMILCTAGGLRSVKHPLEDRTYLCAKNPCDIFFNLFSPPTCLVCDLCLVRSQGHHPNYCDNYFKHFHHIHFYQYSDNFAGWVANNFVRSHSSTVSWPWPCSMNYQWLHDTTWCYMRIIQT